MITRNRAIIFLLYVGFSTYWLNPLLLSFFAFIGVLLSFFVLTKGATRLLLYFFCFFFISLISNFANLDASIAKSIFIPYGIFFLFYFSSHYVSLSLTDVNRAIVLSCFLVSVNMFFQEYSGVYNFSIDYILHKERWMGYFVFGADERVAPNIFSQMVGFGFILCFNFLLSSRSFYSKLIYLFLTSCFLFFVISSGSRSVLIASMLCLVIVLYPYIASSSKGLSENFSMFFYGILFICLFVYFVSFFISQSEDILNRIYSFSDLTSDHSFMTRIGLWGDSIVFAFDNPLGGGFNNFIDYHYLSPHNEILGSLLVSGFVGAFFYILFFIGVGRLSLTAAVLYRNNLFLAFFVFLIFISFGEHFTYSSGRYFAPVAFAFLGYMSGLVVNNKYS